MKEIELKIPLGARLLNAEVPELLGVLGVEGVGPHHVAHATIDQVLASDTLHLGSHRRPCLRRRSLYPPTWLPQDDVVNFRTWNEKLTWGTVFPNQALALATTAPEKPVSCT